jgi:hypothetical protein
MENEVKFLAKRLASLEHSFNLLQIQTNVLQNVVEHHLPDLTHDLDILYEKKKNHYIQARLVSEHHDSGFGYFPKSVFHE